MDRRDDWIGQEFQRKGIKPALIIRCAAGAGAIGDVPGVAAGGASPAPTTVKRDRLKLELLDVDAAVAGIDFQLAAAAVHFASYSRFAHCAYHRYR